MGILTKAFKSTAGLIGEILVAGTGIAVIYGIGFVSGAKQGSKVSSLVDDIRDKINHPDPAEEAEEETTEEVVTDEDEDADEDETSISGVSITPPEE